MLVTNHVLLGASVGALLKRPWLALPVGVASHVALDSVPHWGMLPEGLFLKVAVVDGLVGLSVIAFVVLRSRALPRIALLAGMFGAALPDLDKPARVLLGVDLWPGWVDRVHWGVQSESPTRWWVEVLSALLLSAVFLFLASRSARRPQTGEEGVFAAAPGAAR